MKSKYLIISVLYITLSGCGLFDSGSDTVIGKYNVCWIDLQSHRSLDLAYKDGEGGGGQIVPYYVFAVGHDQRFIVAKQHPILSNDKVDISKTFYWIIYINQQDKFWKDGKPQGIFGPLNKPAYDSFFKINKLEQIKFDQTYPEDL